MGQWLRLRHVDSTNLDGNMSSQPEVRIWFEDYDIASIHKDSPV
jgi:hypothetical protein